MTEQELEQMEANEDGNHPCPKCQAETPNARAVLLLVMTCRECTPPPEIPKFDYRSDEREGEGGSYEPVLDEKGYNQAKYEELEDADKTDEAEALEASEKLNADE